MNRRRALQGVAAGVTAALVAPRALLAADYDLVIRGGRVIDPAQSFDGVADVAIADGKIAAVARDLALDAGVESLDARGNLVVPGLVDVHLHARDAELPPVEVLKTGGVTTMVDAGSKGADNVREIVDIARQAPNRLRVLLNIANLGNNNPNGRAEFLDGIERADVDKARRAVEQNREWIVGIKARLSKGVAAERDREVLRRALDVAQPFAIPVMIHVGDTFTPLPELLAMLRPGDVVTHMYAPVNGILDAAGRVLPPVREARRRGVLFDIGHGLNEHWRWDVAERALEQGFAPDTISSDLNLPGRTQQVFDLPNVLSKFLLLGMPLTEVIACVTSRAARTFHALSAYGSLREGAVADVAVLEMTTGAFEFADNYKDTRTGSQRLVTRAVVYGGQLVR
jgi:dihydroorotase